MKNTLYWLTLNFSDIPQDTCWLNEKEKVVFSGLRFEKRRNDWMLGRWTVKNAIIQYLIRDNLKESHLEIRAATDGAPEAFYDDVPLDISISISHAAQKSLCVVGPKEQAIGCDLEVLEPREDSLFLDYFTPEEIALCRQVNSGQKTIITNLIWSAKESMLKCLREGLRMDTRSVQVIPDFETSADGWNRWTGHCPDLSRCFFGWWRLTDGFVYTISSDQSLLIENSSLIACDL